MLVRALDEFLAPLVGDAPLEDYPRLLVSQIGQLRGPVLNDLIRVAVFGHDPERATARWLIWHVAAGLGIFPASAYDLYAARGRGEVEPAFTVPAFNLRALPYDMAQVVFGAAVKQRAGAFLLELARSEMAYTNQEPAEYVACILAGAIQAGYRGPVFVQGDHFKIHPDAYHRDSASELNALQILIIESIQAGFYHFDLDASTLAKPDLKNANRQQHDNYALTAELIAFIRAHQPAGVTITIGGEIGDQANANSTEPELRAFLEGLRRSLGEGLAGLSKITVQTGTLKGGLLLPDGRVASVALDFGALLRLSQVAREYGLAGAVQHGASTLPSSVFFKFIQSQTAEIHLATDFQNILFEHQAFPHDLRREMYAYLDAYHAHHRRPAESVEQFYYRERKRVIGPFKERLWALGEDVRGYIREAWQQRLEFLFAQLNVAGTRDLVDRYVPNGPQPRPPGDFLASDAS